MMRPIGPAALACAAAFALAAPASAQNNNTIAAFEPLIGYWAGAGTVQFKRGEPEREVTCRANYKFTSDEKTKIKASVTCDGPKAKSTFVAFISAAKSGDLRGSWWQSQGDTSGELGGDLEGAAGEGGATFKVDAAGKTRGTADISIGAHEHSFVVRAIDDASQSLNITFRR